MIIVKLQGGLGNQMFQYATARALQMRFRDKIYVDLDFLDPTINLNSDITPRNFELPIFNAVRLRQLKKWQKKIILNSSFYKKIISRILYGKTAIINQQKNQFVTFPRSYDTLYIEGYFQSEKYFSSIRAQLLADFKFPDLDNINEKLKQDICSNNNTVSIHIRRGDYLNETALKFHGLISMRYYKNSLDYLESKLGEELHYYIFTEDTEWVEEQFHFLANLTIVKDNKGSSSWKDIVLMKACKHHIIANSSFSWWGAWLSENNGITIVPKNWYVSSEANYDVHDIIPSKWIIMSDE